MHASSSLLALTAGLALVHCAGTSRPASHATPTASAATGGTHGLDPRITGWLPANRARIEAMFAARGRGSPGYDPAHPPVATFDWDNTVMRNDIGDATMAWMLRHDAILQPPARDWSATSGGLTPAARAALNAACDRAGEPGAPLRTSTTPACADEILQVYTEGRTMAGAQAWTREVTLTMNEGYAWLARLLAGHTPAEVARFAREAFAQNNEAAVGAVQTVGTHASVTGWVRIYPAMRDLIAALHRNGFDPWIVSASPQHVTEVVAAQVGIAPDHVIGVRTTAGPDGRLGYHLEGCGDAPADSLITFNHGKRCWINRVIFHQPEAAQRPRADPAHRQAFAAGDSDTDVAFVQDATELKLVINRNRVQIMCNAYNNAGDRWLVQPMFIQPLPQRAEPYPCSTARDAEGTSLVDETGQPMADQPDRVFALP